MFHSFRVNEVSSLLISVTPIGYFFAHSRVDMVCWRIHKTQHKLLATRNNPMIIDPTSLQLREVYQLVIGSVVPRPIAWVSTVAPDGTYNLAPFSYFMGITHDPPTFAISCNWRRATESPKDTLANIQAAREFVINIVNEEIAPKMNLTSGEYPANVDEFKLAGLTPVPGQVVNVPYVAEAPISIECKLEQIVYVGRTGAQSGLVIGQGLIWHVRDDLLTPKGSIDVGKLHAVGRLSGSFYSRTRNLFEMERPK
jgi:flavin reductase (DIM6/NTAB) family NADH-FMN oxidoreductase RutF